LGIQQQQNSSTFSSPEVSSSTITADQEKSRSFLLADSSQWTLVQAVVVAEKQEKLVEILSQMNRTYLQINMNYLIDEKAPHFMCNKSCFC
jgi:hypothetical protein